ncbi:hypothetical protein KIPB_005201 [Kipferlia bialata]|uniref:Metallo-beta-lactamase domain-containing protein n=1 Tax=Kipferlia bialata TaxID=797122 RepID=A0A9K3GH44_9EUKA|nr:hypothetical protein KIPB_005201 [Kipferlia bialata]|eukprot:g5201.t1
MPDDLLHCTVLCDNSTNRVGCRGEVGFSILLRTGGRLVLLDTGPSDTAVHNADVLGIDVTQIDTIVLSHGHFDHTWGLMPILARRAAVARCNAAKVPWGDTPKGAVPVAKPILIANRGVFDEKWRESASLSVPVMGCLCSKAAVSRACDVRLGRGEPVWLTDRLVWLGQIPRVTPFESVGDLGLDGIDGGEGERENEGVEGEGEKDTVDEDSALAYVADEGLVIVAGCSHSGIVNIIKRARAVTGVNKIRDLVGGLHLRGNGKREKRAAEWLKANGVYRVHACHCTAMPAKLILAEKGVLPHETGAGTDLYYHSGI